MAIQALPALIAGLLKGTGTAAAGTGAATAAGAGAGAAGAGGLLKGALGSGSAAAANGGGKKSDAATEGSQLAQMQQRGLPGPAGLLKMGMQGAGGMPSMSLGALPAPQGAPPAPMRPRTSTNPFSSSRRQTGDGLLAEYLKHQGVLR